ncbi:MAG: hypothetical protein MUP61_04750, partial [Burkholderiales bacterium]|nr:hypothetical protein [Burkholderiales bacterium]
LFRRFGRQSASDLELVFGLEIEVDACHVRSMRDGRGESGFSPFPPRTGLLVIFPPVSSENWSAARQVSQ